MDRHLIPSRSRLAGETLSSGWQHSTQSRNQRPVLDVDGTITRRRSRRRCTGCVVDVVSLTTKVDMWLDDEGIYTAAAWSRLASRVTATHDRPLVASGGLA